MNIGNNWETIRTLFEEAFKSCAHFSVATVNEDGTPGVTPIGGLILRDNQTGFYFDEFPRKLSANIKRNPRVCILAVNADKAFWGMALVDGKFKTPPAVRLLGTVGEAHRATPDEIAAWQERVAIARGTKGYDILWAKMAKVRDIAFDAFEPVNLGDMTAGLWQTQRHEA
ncbi:MAG: pyridoxamine 5'-phosphate oxidase family protein [Deltaproteobacteria bacterium]|nr:pyridoxamine 5'-phosphate oxidase family protein [Deltaproteobacteria bacterium]